MNSALRLQTFRCPYLHSTISRSACGARHEFYAAKGGASADSVTACACRVCPIGMQHAKGHAADVALVQVAPRVEPMRKIAKLCPVCGEPVGSGPPRRGRGRRPLVCGNPRCGDFAAFEHQDDMLLEWA